MLSFKYGERGCDHSLIRYSKALSQSWFGISASFLCDLIIFQPLEMSMSESVVC